MLLVVFAVLYALLQPQVSFANPIAFNASKPVTETTCNGQTFTYEELTGFGYLASDTRDKYGDTVGGIGSAIALDKKSWSKKDGLYEGILYGLPDRGWNTQGTQNTQPRIHKFSISLKIASDATVANPSPPNFNIKYLDTVLLTDPSGNPATGLDADASGFASFPGFPDLPVATYTGDGFGGNGTGGKRVSIDSEGLFLGDDGSFWISDEYGPYIYHFDKSGKMLNAIRPPDAYIPMRDGAESFNSDTPPVYDPNREVSPTDPTTGRGNNQGFEGLTVSPNGKSLFVLLQSALIQEGGSSSKNRRYARLLKYDISMEKADLNGEYVVPLPILQNDKVAGQSEIHYISPTQFLVLARDSGAGHGQDDTESKYRNADVFDISKATDIRSKKHDAFDGDIASSKGKLDDAVTPAAYCPWLSYNVNDQLNRFGAHNGGDQNVGLLNEKWESFALAPVDENWSDEYGTDGKEYFLISFSDNDYVTQNGYINFGKNKYSDASGFNIDSQALVFKVKLPKGSDPL